MTTGEDFEPDRRQSERSEANDRRKMARPTARLYYLGALIAFAVFSVLMLIFFKQ